jgi:hypothetical protein
MVVDESMLQSSPLVNGKPARAFSESVRPEVAARPSERTGGRRSGAAGREITPASSNRLTPPRRRRCSDAVMPSHKKFNDKMCVYCATQLATTEDHVFARGFFVEACRDNLPKVPACQPCNQ